MPIGFLIGVGSGLASALLFYSAARGSPLLGTLLLLLTPLPSLLAGLGWGWLPAAAGALAGAAVMAVVANACRLPSATSWRSGVPVGAGGLSRLPEPARSRRRQRSASGIRPAACWRPCRSTAARCRC